MILSAQSIRRRRSLITPFVERTVSHGMTYGLSSAGYDIRVAESILLFPGEFFLGSSIERFSMHNDLLAQVADKSSWARKGLFVQNTIIEPGWCGYLTLEITNNSKNHLRLISGMPIAQIVFQLLDEPTEQPYRGKYNNQRAGAVRAIEEISHESGLEAIQQIGEGKT